ncbi:hypothetical protein ACTMTF_08800 [Nonomuraea sp. ZG12]|uniref:hypothetical protein n=1 Tax=Nonomuraea sp. ZG12 TaxID=3452207 RepID=UPI003F8C1D22
MIDPGPRVVLVPDLGEDLARAMARLEESLLILRAAEADGAVLPGPLAGGAALGALRRLWQALAPTQGRRAAAAWHAGRLYSPGRDELVPLRLVDGGAVREALEPDGAELVAVAAGISGLLDLADTGDTILLRERLAAAGLGADVVLTPVEERAYRATTDRFNAMWPRP